MCPGPDPLFSIQGGPWITIARTYQTEGCQMKNQVSSKKNEIPIAQMRAMHAPKYPIFSDGKNHESFKVEDFLFGKKIVLQS